MKAVAKLTCSWLMPFPYNIADALEFLVQISQFTFSLVSKDWMKIHVCCVPENSKDPTRDLVQRPSSLSVISL